MNYSNSPGYLEKDDIIKMQQADIEMLRRELRGRECANEMYRRDIDKLLKEQMEGYKGPSLTEIIDAVARTGAHEAGYWVTRAWAHIIIAAISGCLIGFLIAHYAK